MPEKELTPFEMKWSMLALASMLIEANQHIIDQHFIDHLEKSKKAIDKFFDVRESSINKIAYKLAGIDPEAAGKPEEQTPEFKEAIEEAESIYNEIEKETLNKLLNKSQFMQALNILSPEYNKELLSEKEAEISLFELAAIYFFTVNKDLNPMEAAELPPEAAQELNKIYERLQSYFKDEEFEDVVQGLDKFVKFAETNSESKEIINALRTVIPKYHIIPNTALSNYLTSGDLSKPFNLRVINKKGKQKEITNYTIVSYDPGSTIAKVAENMTEYERGVYNAICSIYLAAIESGQPPIFTKDMLYRAMPGCGDKPSEQEKGAIKKAIEKHRFTHIDSDITEELRAKKLIPDDIEEVTLNDFILSVKEVKVRMKNGGQKVTAYMINSIPLLLEYAQLTNNRITVSKDWLEVKKVKGGKVLTQPLSMTPQRKAITGYLIRRIKTMKNDKKNKKPTQSDTILYDTLFKTIGIPAPDKQKAADIRKFCNDLLEYYKAKGFIIDYQQQKEGRSITGIIIEL